MNDETEYRIDDRLQSKHIQGQPDVDWVLIHQIERDICLLYHQQSHYPSIMGDLYYGDVYSLPYWEYLTVQGDADEPTFIRDGCLIMILAMCDEYLSGAGGYIKPFVSSCLEAVSRLRPEDDDTNKLVQGIGAALKYIASGHWVEYPSFSELRVWAHKTYVRSYFKYAAEQFDTDPVFHTGE